MYSYALFPLPAGVDAIIYSYTRHRRAEYRSVLVTLVAFALLSIFLEVRAKHYHVFDDLCFSRGPMHRTRASQHGTGWRY